MFSSQEDLKTLIRDNVILPKQLDNFFKKGYEIFYDKELLTALAIHFMANPPGRNFRKSDDN